MAADRPTKSISLDADLIEWVDAECETENRTFSNFIETLLMRERGQRIEAQAERSALALATEL